MELNEGEYTLVEIQQVLEGGIKVTAPTEWVRLPFSKCAVTNNMSRDQLRGLVGEEVPIEAVNTDSFDAEIRIMDADMLAGDKPNSKNNFPLPGSTMSQSFTKVNGVGHLVADIKGPSRLEELRIRDNQPGAVLNVEILHIKPNSFGDGLVGLGHTIDRIQLLDPGSTIEVNLTPEGPVENDALGKPAFLVPERFSVRYRLESDKNGDLNYSLLTPGPLPVEDQFLQAEIKQSERSAIVKYDSNIADVPDSLLSGSYNQDQYTVDLFEPAPCDGIARIRIRESQSKSSSPPRAEVEQILSVSGTDDSRFAPGSIIQAITKAGSSTAQSVDGDVGIELRRVPAVSTEVGVEILDVENGEPQGEITQLGKLPRKGNQLTVEYPRRGTEIYIEDSGYTAVLNTTPAFAEQARIEITGEFDETNKTVSARHVEYLSHPDIGDEITVSYNSDNDVCTHPQSGLELPLDRSFNHNGKLTVELQLSDGRPISKVTSVQSVPQEGNTVLVEGTIGEPIANGEPGYSINLHTEPDVSGQLQVEVTENASDRLAGRIIDHRTEEIKVGDTRKGRIKYDHNAHLFDQESPSVRVHLEEPPAETGLYEVEITRIGQRVRGRIVSELETIDKDDISEDGDQGSHMYDVNVSKH